MSPDNTGYEAKQPGPEPHTTKHFYQAQFPTDAMETGGALGRLVSLIGPYAPRRWASGQQPFAVQTLLRIHFMQQWFKLSDPAMEEALNDVPPFGTLRPVPLGTSTSQ